MSAKIREKIAPKRPGASLFLSIFNAFFLRIFHAILYSNLPKDRAAKYEIMFFLVCLFPLSLSLVAFIYLSRCSVFTFRYAFHNYVYTYNTCMHAYIDTYIDIDTYIGRYIDIETYLDT